jgi:ribosomal-protein-alanine N-acetyltransferase
VTRRPGWPARLTHGRVTLRPLRLRDAAAWSEVRLANEAWLTPWESTPPGQVGSFAERQTRSAGIAQFRLLRRAARQGTMLPFVIGYDGRLVGQITVGNVVRGSFNSAFLGYWVDGRLAGRGIAPVAVALVTDHCFGPVGLHRVEANVRPENAASRRVVEKLGFREEGLHRRYLAIDGAYRDHICYALTTEDVPGGVLARYLAR